MISAAGDVRCIGPIEVEGLLVEPIREAEGRSVAVGAEFAGLGLDDRVSPPLPSIPSFMPQVQTEPSVFTARVIW